MSKTKHFATKIILIGSPTVGKTSLRRSYLGKSFRANYLQTIGADFSIFSYKVNEHDEASVVTQNSLWDIAGQDLYEKAHPRYFRGSHAALVIFDVTNPDTFDVLDTWIERFTSLSNLGKIIAVIGNKIDLEVKITQQDQDTYITNLRQRLPDYTILSYRTSAKIGTNIQSCVQTTVEAILKQYETPLEKEVKRELKIDDYLPAAYIMMYDDFAGPSIIKKSPSSEVNNKEFISAMKISTLIDTDLLDNSPHVEGSSPWQSPNGSLHYIAFINLLNKDSNKLFIISFVADHNLDDMLLSKSEVISGFLHKVMNEFNRIVINAKDSIEHIGSNTLDFDTILLKLRLDIFNLVKNEL
ncbi:MAG: GTP-binding protein [Candidatus Heimdallarchaeota archaeon]|nr:GTP-binding protein [Candidatus Heimdallarchaeota archaeon]